MGKINSGRLALALGTFAAVMHIIWSIFVALGWADPFIRFVQSLHFIVESDFYVAPFNLGTAVTLVIFAFIAAYIVGWIFASCWNMVKKQS